MIFESAPWKKQLVADARIIERWAAKKQVSKRRSILIEKKWFLAAYSIRKLYEAQKISTAFGDRSLRCPTYEATSTPIHRMNSHRLGELYDLENSVEKSIAVLDLINLLIHSYLFVEVIGDDEVLEGVFVTSDRTRHDCLWFIRVGEFLRIMRDVGNDYPSAHHAALDGNRGDWYVWQGEGEPPRHAVAAMEKLTADEGEE